MRTSISSHGALVCSIHTLLLKYNNMKYEHEITFNDNSIQYLESETNYLSDIDKQFLEEVGVDLETIKSVYTYTI